MSEEYDDQDGRLSAPGPDPVDEAEQQHVARLLAAASSDADAQVPPDVAARLDEVLAGLVAERATASDRGAESPGGGGGVVGTDELAVRRRRRWPALLVAAASVSVVGLGVGNMLSGQEGADSMVAGESGSADSGGSANAASEEAAAGQASPGSDRELAGDSALTDSDPRALRAQAPRPLRLRTDSLAVDLERAEVFSLVVPVAADPAALRRACVQPPMSAGDEWARIRLDGERGVLVLRAARDGRRTAEVFTCDDADTPAAELRLDVP